MQETSLKYYLTGTVNVKFPYKLGKLARPVKQGPVKHITSLGFFSSDQIFLNSNSYTLQSQLGNMN